MLSPEAENALWLMYAGDLEAADFAFQQVVANDPADPSGHYGLALIWWWRALVTDGGGGTVRVCEEHLNAALSAAEALEGRQPVRAAFFRGRAFGTRALLRAVERRWFAASQDTRRMHSALSNALELQPDLTDAMEGLGLYDVAGDLATLPVKILSTLLFMPRADQDRGIERLHLSAEGTGPFAPEAKLFLAAVEYAALNDPIESLDTLAELERQFPDNPYLAAMGAYVYLEAFGDMPRAEAELTRALGLAESGQELLVWPATLQRAGTRFLAGRIREALEDVRALDSEPPELFVYLRAWALILEARILYQVGQTDAADAAIERVLANEEWERFHDNARSERSRPHSDLEIAIFMANLPGRRLLAEAQMGGNRAGGGVPPGPAAETGAAGARDNEEILQEARLELERVFDHYPDNPQTRYHLAELTFSEGDFATAAREFSSVGREAPELPTWLAPWAWVKAGWAYDSQGRHDLAVAAYDKAREYEGRYDELAARVAERFIKQPYQPVSIGGGR
jgi:tetratricopeptide (TPR) repeat protein